MEHYGKTRTYKSIVTSNEEFINIPLGNSVSYNLDDASAYWDLPAHCIDKRDFCCNVSIDGTTKWGMCEVTEMYWSSSYSYVYTRFTQIQLGNKGVSNVWERRGYLNASQPNFASNFSSIQWTPWYQVEPNLIESTALNVTLSNAGTSVTSINNTWGSAMYDAVNKWGIVCFGAKINMASGTAFSTTPSSTFTGTLNLSAQSNNSSWSTWLPNLIKKDIRRVVPLAAYLQNVNAGACTMYVYPQSTGAYNFSNCCSAYSWTAGSGNGFEMYHYSFIKTT